MQIKLNEIEQMQLEIDKFNQLAKLKRGDIVALKNGNEYEFTDLKRKNFTGISLQDGKPYRIPITSFDKFVRAGEKKAENWKDLKPGELFYIVQRNDALLFKFKEFGKSRGQVVLLGINVANKVPTKISTELYGGKVSDL